MGQQKERLNEILTDTLSDWEVDCQPETIAQMTEHLLENDVTVQKCGRWQYVDGDLGYSQVKCSVCSKSTVFGNEDDIFPYCPFCGAKMMDKGA